VAPWNKPGGTGGDKNPWGQGGGEQGPPDLDEIVRKLQQKLSGLFGGGKRSGDSGGGHSMPSGSGIGLGLVLFVLIGMWLASGLYVVAAGERAVVLRFGKKSEVTQSGLHWHLPYPVETVLKVDVKKTYRIEIGYRNTVDNKVPSESLMLTKDENIVDLGFGIQYRIAKADDYLFNVRNVEDTIRQATESAIREVAGNSTMDFLLTEGREQVAVDVHKLLQGILDEYKTGILVTEVRNQHAGPPDDVQAAFDDAVRAREDEQRYINDAQAYARKVSQLAQGQVVRMDQEAVAYRTQVEERSRGDAQRFDDISREYAKAPRVTRERMYLETVEAVMSNSTKVLIDQKGGNNMIYLPLDKLVRDARPAKQYEELSAAPAPRATTSTPPKGDDSQEMRGQLPATGRLPR
jgi:membrane protease subunit HflK